MNADLHHKDEDDDRRKSSAQHAAASALYCRGTPGYDKEMARLLGKEILYEELGTDTRPFANVPPYDLQKDVSDTLLAHTRQDVATNFGLISAVLDRVAVTERKAKNLEALAWVQLVLLATVVAGLVYR
ncbi:hypothetical protein [Pararhodobacter aggregans]